MSRRFEPISSKRRFAIYLSLLILLFSVAFIFLPVFLQLEPDFFLLRKSRRTETLVTCLNMNEPNRIHYEGGYGSYISSADGRNLKQLFNVPLYYALDSFPSPDGSRIAYPQKDGIWIRCTYTEGMYKIPFESKIINGKNIDPSLLVERLSWAPDSVHFVLNYGGDLIKVNSDTMEKIVIYPNVAWNEVSYEPNQPEPPHWCRIRYNSGSALWTRNGSVYYTKFIGEKVELRVINREGQDDLVLASDFPMEMNDSKLDEDLLVITETIWWKPYCQNPERFPAPQYSYNPKVGTRGRVSSYDESGFSDDGRYKVIHITENGYQVVSAVQDLQTSESFDIKQKIGRHLKSEGLWKEERPISIQYQDWSKDNKLLLYVYDDRPYKRGWIITSDYKGDELDVIYINRSEWQEVFPKRPFLRPISWL